MLDKDKTKKRKERHSITQEDFTPNVVVEMMLNQLPQDIYTDFSKKILDNSCGIGNLLVGALQRRLEHCSNPSDAFEAVKTIYGVELMADNVEECRTRLYGTIINKFPSIEENIELNYKIRSYIKSHIMWYDSLQFDYKSWGKIRTMGKKDNVINFREIPSIEDTKFPMWYKEKSKTIQLSLFNDDCF